MSAWDEIDEVLSRYDASARIESASLCAWWGELRLTLTNPDDAPSRSVTFFSAGGGDPEEVARRLLADFAAWLSEGHGEPMPVPEWTHDGGSEAP